MRVHVGYEHTAKGLCGQPVAQDHRVLEFTYARDMVRHIIPSIRAEYAVPSDAWCIRCMDACTDTCARMLTWCMDNECLPGNLCPVCADYTATAMARSY